MDWYYQNHGKPTGPMPEETILHFLRIGALNARSPVWNDTMAEWAPVEETPLAAFLPTSEPAPEPAPQDSTPEVPAPVKVPEIPLPAQRAQDVVPRPALLPEPRTASGVPWLIAILLVIATGLFFILDGPQYVSRLKARWQPAKPAAPAQPRMQAEGYFLTTTDDGKKMFTAVVSVPPESWIPGQKEFEDTLKKNGQQAGERTREQMRHYVPARFTFFHEDRTKSPAKSFLTASADGTAKNFMPEVTEFITAPAPERRRKVMPTWELGPGELPKPLRIQFDDDEPVVVPDKIVAPATGEDAALKHTETPVIPEGKIPALPGNP